MTGKHFIQHIEIENFKCFDSLKADHLRRVNLLGGDNNVGKSAFLEALEIVARTENSRSFIRAVRDVVRRRQAHHPQFADFDVISYEKDSLEFKSNTISIALRLGKEHQLSFFNSPYDDEENMEFDRDSFVEFVVNDDSDRIPYGRFRDMIERRSFMPAANARLSERADFIPATSLNEKKLSGIYGHIVDMGRTEDINNFLKDFDSRIESLAVRPTEQYSVFKVKLADKDIPVLLSSMGGGLNRYIAIVCAIWKTKDGQLFIDEVENGIHYTKYDKLWEIIFKTSQKANCQVFATSHSKECIQAFSRVAEKHDHENMKYVNFSRTVDHPEKIVATVLDSVGLESHFQLGLDVR